MEEKTIESLNNCWKALLTQYQDSPSEEMRYAVNLVGKICAKVKNDYDNYKNEDGKQITIDEWLAWLESNI